MDRNVITNEIKLKIRSTLHQFDIGEILEDAIIAFFHSDFVGAGLVV